MYLKSLEVSGFKSFAKKTELYFGSSITAVVGPNGSGKSNIAEAFRFCLGEQSIKSMRGKRGEDLIFNGGKAAPRANRAQVKVVFDNRKRFLNIDFDEVSIERVVHRDGVNEYSINGSRVRLRDVLELLSSANIGATGHHIISQGETDRILSANLKERREMIEDALGLKIFHYKKEESERRLLKTKENIAHVESLRKEIAPHLSFLKKQAEKIEKAATMRGDLTELYLEYLKREREYVTFHSERIAREKKAPTEALNKFERELAKAKITLEKAGGTEGEGARALELERALSVARKEKETLSRELGRLEGQIVFEEKQQKLPGAKSAAVIPVSDLETVVSELEATAERSRDIDDIQGLRTILTEIPLRLRAFLTKYKSKQPQEIAEDDLVSLRAKKRDFDQKMTDAEKRENEITGSYKALQAEIEEAKDETRQAERDMFRIMSEQGKAQNVLDALHGASRALALEEENFKRELGEAVVLAGKEVLSYEQVVVQDAEGNTLSREAMAREKRAVQDERRRKIEKIKIRLEEFGGSSGDEVMKEYREAEERDAFLGREIADLEASADSLAELISELEAKLDTQFKEGLEKINTEFSKFFELMFGGGSASLSVMKAPPRRRRSDTSLEDLEEGDLSESEESEEGIDIAVHLPHKRIKGLQMLSGGERALTSIALLFAMSQVNPPPFIILDETDAALDEANSKRYGDMIENLAKKSQLILISHNRETMSRAGILYGVTMGGDGISKLLSVAFEEAVVVAK